MGCVFGVAGDSTGWGDDLTGVAGVDGTKNGWSRIGNHSCVIQAVGVDKIDAWPGGEDGAENGG